MNIFSNSKKLNPLPSPKKFADTKVLTFDIETTHEPLKFPDKETDSIMMISWMENEQGSKSEHSLLLTVTGFASFFKKIKGFLLVNRQFVAADIVNFEFNPKRGEIEASIKVTNVQNERELLQVFFKEIREYKPQIIVSYNGDSFDFPFIEARAKINGLKMFEETAIRCDSNG